MHCICSHFLISPIQSTANSFLCETPNLGTSTSCQSNLQVPNGKSDRQVDGMDESKSRVQGPREIAEKY